MHNLPTAAPLRPRKSRAADGFVLISLERPEDGAAAIPGATITGRGWALASVDIERIEVRLGEAFAAHVNYGEFRPDVAEKFPGYPQADQSGFSFSLRLPAEPVEELIVVVRTADGRETRKIVSIRAPEYSAAAAFRRGGEGAAVAPARLFVEDARIDEAGILRARGWAVSLAPLTGLRLFLDGVALGAPETGLPRSDVALAHPDYPNAADCGFQLIQHIDGEIGRDPVLRVQALCQGGLTRQILAPVGRRSGARRSSQIGGTQFCCDIVSLSSRGQALASGWAVAESGVASILVELDGVPIGEAKTGLARPDVGNRFPRVPSARQAGFHFSHETGVAFEGEHVLTFRVRSVNGEEETIPLPVQAQEAPREDESRDPGGSARIRFDLDAPALAGDAARDPVRAILRVAGWAVSPGGIDHVEVFVDERGLGRAYYGQRREDVAAAFPEWPDALLCGFAMHIRASDIGTGDHAIRVVIRGKDGDTAERAFTILCEKSTDIPPHETLRRKIGQAEIDHALAILDRRGHCVFDIHIRMGKGQEAAARRTLEDLRAQAYPNFRVTIDGADELAAEAAEAGVAGEAAFVCVLDAGDRLGPDALLEFAVHAALNPADDFIYSDDRRRDPATGGGGPFFKPDWSPDLLLSCNYIGRAWVARAAGLRASELAGLGGYGRVLRLTERARSIGHVARLLLHEADDADGTGEAAPAGAADLDALADALDRRGIAATAAPGRAGGTYRVARRVTAPGRVSVIIPTIAARGLIETTIRGLREKTDWPDIEIVCLDNIPPGENLHWKAWLRENADRVIEIAEPFNWSRFNNIGAAAASGDYLLFLNDDIEVIHPEWMEVLVSHAQRPEVGVVGAQLLYPDGKVQHAGMFFTAAGGRHAFRFANRDDPGPFGLALSERNMLAVTGACMMMRRAAYEVTGGFNETHSVVNNDVDYCLRARRAGQLVVFTPHATLVHHELASRAKMADVYNETDFLADWGSVMLKGDPYFNRNLAQDSDTWAPESEPTEAVYAGHPLIARRRVRRILATKLDHIGDFVTAMPALRRLKERFPDAELHVLCAKASLALAKLEPALDGAIEFNFFHARSGEGQLEVSEAELLELRERLAPYRFDLAVDLRLQPDTRRVLGYTGASVVAGFENDGLFPWLDLSLPWEGDTMLRAKRVHVSDRLTQLVEAVSVACESERAVMGGISAAEARRYVAAMPAFAGASADFFADTVVCVHPGVGNETRQWPAEHFASLIDLLIGETGAKVMIIGVGEEAKIASSVLEKVTRPEGVLSMVGKTSLRDLPYVLRAATLYVGNNSGPKHLAAALGVPTLGVHSAVVEAPEWAPLGPNAAATRRKVYCGPCYLAYAAQCQRGLACLTGLRPVEVFEMTRRMLGAA